MATPGGTTPLSTLSCYDYTADTAAGRWRCGRCVTFRIWEVDAAGRVTPVDKSKLASMPHVLSRENFLQP
jgi:hypothetical protein